MFKTVLSENTRDLISEFVKTDFTLKYNNSILGFLWVLIKPLVLFLVLLIITSRVFPNGGIKYYPLHLLMGTIVLSYWSEGTMSGMGALLNKSALILKVNFPRYIAIVSSVLLPLINFLINFMVFLFIEIVFFHIVPSLTGVLIFLLSIVTLFTLILGFSLFTSIIFVKLRDVGSIWELILNLTFWITPVVYSVSVIRSKSEILGFLIEYINPLTVVLNGARYGLLPGQEYNMIGLFVWFGISIIIFFLGYFYFRSEVSKVAESF